MPFVHARGHQLYYTSVGNGPVIVLLHGLFHDSSVWHRNGVVDELAKRFRVLCLDSLGHGQSDRPEDAACHLPQRQVDGVIALLNTVGAEQAHVIGYSMGSWLALALARDHPDRVASLAIGGWDPILGSGALTPDAKPIPFDSLLAWAWESHPDAVAWVSVDAEPALRAAWTAAGRPIVGAVEVLTNSNVPIIFVVWRGGSLCAGDEGAFRKAPAAAADDRW